jgi:hypothetical protein
LSPSPLPSIAQQPFEGFGDYFETLDRTVPETLPFICHGYDEGVTRAYNCIPSETDKVYMPTFVPPAGSLCNDGSIQEFPPGRLVFQIRCEDPPPVMDIKLQNVRYYEAITTTADWIYFDIVAGRSLSAFTLQVRLEYEDGTFRNCNEYVSALVANQVEEGLIIPSVCGPDVQWWKFVIVKPAHLTCEGCNRYYRASDDLHDGSATAFSLPGSSERAALRGRAISPTAADNALEAARVIEEYQRRSTTIER